MAVRSWNGISGDVPFVSFCCWGCVMTLIVTNTYRLQV